MEAGERELCARKNFLDGCNCPQSVVRAFDDVLQEHDIDPVTAMRLASPFGGGMGRMREVCGAVSGMLMILGLVEGYTDPADDQHKAELYAHVQELADKFRQEHGTIICRELLGKGEGSEAPTPEARTQAYYHARPCAEFCATAARILGEYLEQ
ncbi:MAG: C-GCAxxG-C-C family protein [Coriobacteriales bacterium]|nr:C-GCAxxG-C-C family protein [Coriobacteriales bacterium]